MARSKKQKIGGCTKRLRAKKVSKGLRRSVALTKKSAKNRAKAHAKDHSGKRGK